MVTLLAKSPNHCSLASGRMSSQHLRAGTDFASSVVSQLFPVRSPRNSGWLLRVCARHYAGSCVWRSPGPGIVGRSGGHALGTGAAALAGADRGARRISLRRVSPGRICFDRCREEGHPSFVWAGRTRRVAATSLGRRWPGRRYRKKGSALGGFRGFGDLCSIGRRLGRAYVHEVRGSGYGGIQIRDAGAAENKIHAAEPVYYAANSLIIRNSSASAFCL